MSGAEIPCVIRTQNWGWKSGTYSTRKSDTLSQPEKLHLNWDFGSIESAPRKVFWVGIHLLRRKVSQLGPYVSMIAYQCSKLLERWDPGQPLLNRCNWEEGDKDENSRNEKRSAGTEHEASGLSSTALFNSTLS